MRRALALGLALLAVAACSTTKYAPLPEPETSKGSAVTTSTLADLEQVGLPGVNGTTSTSAPALGPGPITIGGRVDGPDGAVSGAIVEVARVVGTRTATVRVATNLDGTWAVPKVLGGRYRIRSWLAPDLAMASAQVLFIDASNPPPVVLRVDRYAGTTIVGALAPDPPVVGQPANLAVRVTTKAVDGDGYVRSTPAYGAAVTLTGSGSWSSQSTNPAFTGSDGVAQFTIECLQTGPQPLSAVLSDGTSQPLGLAACVSPTPSTTSSTTSTTTR